MGSRIREARKSANMTQADLAIKLGINRATLSKYESGVIEPSVAQLKLIAEKLGEHSGGKIYWYELSSEAEEKKAAMAAQELLKMLPEMKQIVKANGKTDLEFKTDEDRITYFYSKLNAEGRRVAADRVQELSEIPKYRETLEEK